MPITERQINARGDWERKATGGDIPKLLGSLRKEGEEGYKKAFHRDEGNWERISDPHGNPTHIPKDQIDQYRARGYGRVAINPSMVMPHVPWEQTGMKPGKRKYRYNKLSGEMEEV